MLLGWLNKLHKLHGLNEVGLPKPSTDAHEWTRIQTIEPEKWGQKNPGLTAKNPKNAKKGADEWGQTNDGIQQKATKETKRTTNGHECTRMWAGELSRIEQKTTKIREGSRNHKSEIINQKFPFLPSFTLFASVKSFRGSAYSFAPIRLPLNPVFRIPDPAFGWSALFFALPCVLCG